MLHGNFEHLSKAELVTWRGWAIYYWDMCYCVALFDKEPKEIGDPERRWWDFTNANENVGVGLLEACGVDFDYTERSLYYSDILCSQHPPIEIELILPKPVLEQLGLI